MPDFIVSTGFKAVDKHSAVYNKMGNSAERYGIRGSKAMYKINAAQTALISKMKMYAGIALGLGAGLVTREFINFEHAITTATAKFPGLTDGSEESRKTIEKLGLTARKVGEDTGLGATMSAQGLDFMAMAGFNASQSMSLLPGVADLATVANVDLARSTDIASDAIGAFGLMTKDTAQLTKNFTRINDVMATTMTSANTNMEDLFESIKKGAPAFTAAGQNVETFNALAGIMANSGVKGAESGTQLRNVMLRLASPTAEASKFLDKLGVKTQDADGNFRDVVDILADFEKGLQGMGTAQRSAALATVFGARSVTGINILLQEGTENIRKFREELYGASGASERMAKVMRQSLLNRLKILLATTIELGFKFIDAFGGKGGEAIDSITEAVRSLGVVFKLLGKVVAKVLPLIPYLIKGFLAYKLALIGILFYQKIVWSISWIKYLWMMRDALIKAGLVTKAWGAAIAFLTSPILLTTAAIIALGYAIYDLYSNWDKYVLGFKIGMNEWIVKWKQLKLVITGVMHDLGMVSDKALVRAANEFKLAKLETDLMKDKMDKLYNKPISEAIKKQVDNLKRSIDDISKKQESKAIQSQSNMRAPNESEVKARRIDFQGRIDIANAPEGTQIQSQTRGAPAILLQLLGAQ